MDGQNQVAHQIDKLLRETGEHLGADRCFLHIRKPKQGLGRIAFCWRRHEGIPDAIRPEWEIDNTDLPQEDPLIRAALRGKPSIYVDDVRTAPPDVLNRAFEDRTFGHRALIHGHVLEGNTLWGILQPCHFGEPRHWTDADQQFIEQQLPRFLPLIKNFVRLDP